MKIVGLITEYNPFHNGHKYHIEKALEVSGADAAVVIMSGDFVQRGAPAVMPKHLRAEMALRNGAAAVLELPVCFAAGSAEYFAWGAVSILHNLGCIDSICFGSECGDISRLTELAKILTEEPEEFRFLLQSSLKKGLAFPFARQLALEQYTGDPEFASILSKPNNTLALEYLKALIRRKSHMRACTIQRMESDYHEEILRETYSSASAIRTLFQAPELATTDLSSQVPDSVLRILEEHYQTRFPIVSDDLSLLLKYKLLLETKDSLLKYVDMTEELANRIMNKRNDFQSWSQFCQLLKTKEVTYSRISRTLVHVLLHLTKSDMTDFLSNDHALYGRLLGFQKKDANILHLCKESSRIPLITKIGNAQTLTPLAEKMLKTDVFASNLYESIITEKYKSSFVNEHQKQIVIL